MANFIADDIDFSMYMEQTEAGHKILSAGNFAEEVVAYFHDPEVHRGASLPWQKTTDLLKFRPAEVTLWGGMNGHGKSLIIGQMCMGFVTQKQKVCIASFEMRPVVTLARICRQAFGTNKPDPDVIREFHKITDPWIWLYNQQGAVRSEQVLAVIRYSAIELKCEHMVIDSLMKCGVAEDGPSAFQQQKEFINALCVIAKDTGIHIHLVAHSRKQRDELAPPGKMDIKGSGSITDQVDNVITVWRNKDKERKRDEGVSFEPHEPDCLLICDKQRNGEWEGRIGLYFLSKELQFVENYSGMPMRMF